MEYFEDYIDEEGNLHIDARKPKKPYVNKNLLVKKEDIGKSPIPSGKLIIHHVNLIDDGK